MDAVMPTVIGAKTTRKGDGHDSEKPGTGCIMRGERESPQSGGTALCVRSSVVCRFPDLRLDTHYHAWYASFSKPIGPLSQDTLSLGGSFLCIGGTV